MKKNAPPLLIRAAELIEEHAQIIWHSSTTSDGRWNDKDKLDREAHAAHDELIEVAKGLREKEQGDIAFARSLSEAFNTGDGSYHP